MKCPQVAFSLVNSPTRRARQTHQASVFPSAFQVLCGVSCSEARGRRGWGDKFRPCWDPFKLRTVIYITLSHLRLVADPNLKALTTAAVRKADATNSLPCVINSERWQPQRSGILCWTSESSESENILMDFFYILFSTWMTALRPLNRL